MKIFAFILFLFLSLSSKAQFDTLARTDYVVRDMIVFDNKLFIGGHFNSIQDTIVSYWSAYFDDGQFVGHTNPIGGGGVVEFAVFDQELYAVGDWNFPLGVNTGVVKWNGTTWVMEGGPSSPHSNIVVIDNYLYVMDHNGLIRRKAAGGTFEVFKDLTSEPDLYITEAVNYQGQLCIMGMFQELEGLPLRNIAKWNGTTWEGLGTGMSEHAWKALFFQNEFYVAGNFDNSILPAARIAKWNGASWADVGMSITGSSPNGIYTLIPWENRLFAFGDFDGIGNQPADDIAAWDGQQWTPYFVPHVETILNTGVVYNGRLYFSGWDGVGASTIYGYSGLLSLQESTAENTVIYPNPSTGIFTIKNSSSETYKVQNVTGQLILSGNSQTIDLSAHESGVYFLRFETGFTIKLIKD